MIELRGVTIENGDFALRNINLTAPKHGHTLLSGPSGAGKTSLLEAIAGLRPVTCGRILLDGVDVTEQRPANRRLGYVPQDGALFTTHTVAQNLAFGLHSARWPRPRIDARVAELASSLGLTSLLSRYPAGLSGGERQRVALGRALAAGPEVLLLDEPLSALDSAAQQQLHDLLRRMRGETPMTILHVTHQPRSAADLADWRLTIEQGSIRTLGQHQRSESSVYTIRPLH